MSTIIIGPGSLSVAFIAANARYREHVEFRWDERGGFDYAPTGTAFIYTCHPLSIPQLISDLQGSYSSYESWIEEQVALKKPKGWK